MSEAGLEARSGFVVPSLTFPDTVFQDKEVREREDGYSGDGDAAKKSPTCIMSSLHLVLQRDTDLL